MYSFWRNKSYPDHEVAFQAGAHYPKKKTISTTIFANHELAGSQDYFHEPTRSLELSSSTIVDV